MSLTAAEVSADLTVGMLIDGTWETRGCAGEFEHVYPATGRAHRVFPAAGADDVQRAIESARRALVAWRGTSAARRRGMLTSLGAALTAAIPELDAISALERGAPLSGGGPSGASSMAGPAFEYAAGWIDRLAGTTVPIRLDEVFDYTISEPVGVVAVLPSWNGPLWSVAVAVAPALAAGCTVILKAPEQAPFSCMHFGRICDQVGIPAGVVNVLTGGPEVGAMLVSDQGIDKIHFTGGTGTARKIQAAAAEALTPMVLELGGKSANLVFPDADLDRAVANAAGWVTRNAGQSCSGPSRLLVHQAIFDEMIDRVSAYLERVVVGDPFDLATTMGPLISAAACERILGAVQDACANSGAKLLCGGERPGGALADGFFMTPTVLIDVDNGSPIAQQELFGPVTTLTRFATEEEAITLANGSRYGLAGYVHTRDISRALRVASKLEAGGIGINGGSAPAGYMAPFGGFKDSGHGLEGGQWGLNEFLRTKNVMVLL